MRIAVAVALTLVLAGLTAAPLAAEEVIYSFPFDDASGPGWTMTAGEWQYGQPQGLGGDPTTAYTGDYVYGYDLTGDGEYENDIVGTHSLVTTALDCRGFSNVKLRFWRWLGVESATYDHARIWVSNDNVLWYDVWHNPTSTINDSAWTQVEYDISARADGQATVYLRWMIGPTDSSVTYCGWNIDDVEIVGDPATEILAWVPYTDMDPGAEYENTFAALDTHYQYYNATDSTTEDAATLADELVGKDVFLAMEQEGADNPTLETLGAAFSDVLTEFVEQGGTVISLCEWPGSWEGFMSATGLMTADAVANATGATLTVVAPSHPLANRLPGTVTGPNATASYAIGPESTSVIEDPSGNAVLAVRQLGLGAAIMIGYDYFEYDNDAARVIANAVQYPQATGSILLYEQKNERHIAQQALDALAYSYTTGESTNFNSLLTSRYWGLVVVDAPSNKPDGGFGDLISFLDAGGRAAVSTWQLMVEGSLCAAFGVVAEETFTTPQPIYRWEPSHALFTDPADVPDLTTWSDDWTADADRLSYVSGDVTSVAGYTASSTEAQAALVIADGRRILNAFLWDECNQDDDSDSVNDCVELVTNEIEFLRPGPRADFTASQTQCVAGQDLTFTDASTGAPVAWYWQFGDGETSVEQDPTHSYASTGTYTVTLTASNAEGQDTVTKTDYIAVGTAVPDFSGMPTEGIMGMTVDFTDSSSGTVTSWDWDFGDGGTSTDQSPSHDYVVPGIYTVGLTVADAFISDTETKTDYIWVGFLDTESDYWSFEEILRCVQAGIVQGYEMELGEYTYQPEWEVNRAQMAVYIARALAGGDGLVPDATPPATFDDVPDDHWAWKYVEYVVDESVVTGYDENTYSPDVLVDRGQMAVFVARAKGWVTIGDDMSTASDVFPDVPSDYWCALAVQECVDHSVVQGYDFEGELLYKPEWIVTRGQMAVYVARAFGLL